MLHTDSLANLQERPRHRRQSRFDHRLQGSDLLLLDRYRGLADPHKLYDTRDRQGRHSIKQVHLAEHVTIEKRFLDFLDAVRPSPASAVKRQKYLYPLGI